MTDHLVSLEKYLRDAFAQRQQAVGLFFDLEKAYETTWQYSIIRDLHRIGLRGRLPVFVSQYIRDQRMRVRIGTLALRAFCTSPVSSLYTEANGAPLEERRLRLSMHYYVKTRACIDNRAHHALPPKVLLLCCSWGACVPRRPQRLCQLEFWLLVGSTMLDRLWERGQTKCNTPLMLATSVFGRIK